MCHIIYKTCEIVKYVSNHALNMCNSKTCVMSCTRHVIVKNASYHVLDMCNSKICVNSCTKHV